MDSGDTIQPVAQLRVDLDELHKRERERDGRSLVPLVDVDAPKLVRLGRKKSSYVQQSPIIEGTYMDYWLWLCRTTPYDAEPRPVPSIQTPK